MLVTLPFAMAGYRNITRVSSAQAQLGMMCLMSIGMFGSLPCILIWTWDNTSLRVKRLTAWGVQLSIACCGGFLAGA